MTAFDTIGEDEAAQALVDHWNRNHPDSPVGIDDVADAARAVVAAVTAPIAIIGVREAADFLDREHELLRDKVRHGLDSDADLLGGVWHAKRQIDDFAANLESGGIEGWLTDE